MEGKTVKLGGVYFKSEFIDELKEEMKELAFMAQMGLVEGPTPSQKLAYNLLQEEGLL